MENHSFEYTYSARRQQEVEQIRSAYLPKEEDKLVRLRRLHAMPTKKAQAVALSLGIPGTLLLGTGLSLCMTDLGAGLGSFAMLLGIVLGLAGIAGAAMAYPIYSRILKREREKIAPEILQLSEELL